jgi:hypothetical protein
VRHSILTLVIVSASFDLSPVIQGRTPRNRSSTTEFLITINVNSNQVANDAYWQVAGSSNLNSYLLIETRDMPAPTFGI